MLSDEKSVIFFLYRLSEFSVFTATVEANWICSWEHLCVVLSSTVFILSAHFEKWTNLYPTYLTYKMCSYRLHIYACTYYTHFEQSMTFFFKIEMICLKVWTTFHKFDYYRSNIHLVWKVQGLHHITTEQTHSKISKCVYQKLIFTCFEF